MSSRHALTGSVIYFRRKITNATLSTFRPPETTPKFTQAGFSAGLADRLILSAYAVLESTLAVRTFEVDQKTQGEQPMVYAPQGQSGDFFNRQERNVRSLQLVEALTFSKDWVGQHVFKVGMDLQHSRFDGDNYSQEVDVVRLDGSLAERTTYSPRAGIAVSVLPEGREILRGGFGKFAERTPLTVGAFTRKGLTSAAGRRPGGACAAEGGRCRRR